MGPITLFDKSFLQMLSLDESVWFDYHFYPVICPVFITETLSDLAKQARPNSTAERAVRALAEKTPQIHGGPCAMHHSLCLSDLMGRSIPMTGQVPRQGGRVLRKDGKTGVAYEPSIEEEAFRRWREEEFETVERLFARRYRESLNNTDLAGFRDRLKSLGALAAGCKSLIDCKQHAREFLKASTRPHERMALALSLLKIPHEYHDSIFERWKIGGYRPLHSFAPYAAHVTEVHIFLIRQQNLWVSGGSDSLPST